MLMKSSLFLKIQAYLKSPREISYEKTGNKIKIQYFWVPLHNLKKNWPSALFLLVGFGILTNSIKNVIESFCMLISKLAYFFYNRILHISSPKNSSGEQLSGQM